MTDISLKTLAVILVAVCLALALGYITGRQAGSFASYRAGYLAAEAAMSVPGETLPAPPAPQGGTRDNLVTVFIAMLLSAATFVTLADHLRTKRIEVMLRRYHSGPRRANRHQ